jgi:hypothetical protein
VKRIDLRLDEIDREIAKLRGMEDPEDKARELAKYLRPLFRELPDLRDSLAVSFAELLLASFANKKARPENSKTVSFEVQEPTKGKVGFAGWDQPDLNKW